MINQYVEFNIVKLFQSGTEFDHTILEMEYWNNGKGASVIIVRIAMHALPEKQKEVMQTLLSMIESTGKEMGCLSHHVFQDIEDVNAFSLIDEWETREYLNQHIMSAKKSLLCEPLKIQIFTVSDSERIEAVNPVRKKQN
jgi:quinol monooxygenase YgiN